MCYVSQSDAGGTVPGGDSESEAIPPHPLAPVAHARLTAALRRDAALQLLPPVEHDR